MTTFSIDVSDAGLLAGLAAARAAHNAALSEGDAPVATDAEYMQARVGDMLASYASQYGTVTRTISVTQAQGLLATLQAAVEAGVPGASDMLTAAQQIIGG